VADEWYYTNQGQQMGPVSTEELRNFASNGRLQPNDLVWKDGMPKWVPASSVGEFARHESVPDELPPPRRDDRRYDDRDDRDDRRYDRRYDRDEDDDRGQTRRRPAPARQAQGLSTGAKVGIGLGIGGGALLVIILIVVIIVLVATRPGSGGAVNGPGRFTHHFFPNENKRWFVQFRGGGPARVTVVGTHHDNLQLRVYDDMTNQEVAHDVGGFIHERTVTWVPPATRVYRIEVQNADFRGNRVELSHN
jgi:hypothetical protein